MALVVGEVVVKEAMPVEEGVAAREILRASIFFLLVLVA